MPTSAQSKRLAENRELRKNKYVLAFLEMISKSEGTNGDYYKMVYGTVIRSPHYPSLIGKQNVRFPSLARFPEILVKVNSKINSSASGKHQILQKTYKGAAATMGLTDFSEETQDLCAIELLRQRGAMVYILKGDIEGALTKSTVKKEWASFAGAGYNQGENSVKKLVGWFNTALGGVKANPSKVVTGGGSAAVIVIGCIISFFF